MNSIRLCYRKIIDIDSRKPVIWIETVYNQLLISYETTLENVVAGKEMETNMDSFSSISECFAF